MNQSALAIYKKLKNKMKKDPTKYIYIITYTHPSILDNVVDMLEQDGYEASWKLFHRTSLCMIHEQFAKFRIY